MSLRTTAVLLVLSATTILSAQPQVPAAPLQTAREALIEMLTGGEKALMKHLTVEVQDFLNNPKNTPAANIALMFRGLQSQTSNGLQTFPTGSTLFVVNEPAQHKKLEVHIENDDLSADQDTLELSLHSFIDGKEQQDEFGYMLSSISVTMKRQQNVWRLSNIGLGLEFPLGDPEFLKKTFFSGPQNKTPGLAATAMPEGHTIMTLGAPADFDPTSPLDMMFLAESAYAALHPEIGFTCSMEELMQVGKSFNLEPQLAAGSSSYKFNLTGCEGKPAGSFQVIAEPIAQGRGAKAYCVDATHNIRASEDGRGSTCLVQGKTSNWTQAQDEGAVGGLMDGVHIDSTKPKP